MRRLGTLTLWIGGLIVIVIAALLFIAVASIDLPDFYGAPAGALDLLLGTA